MIHLDECILIRTLIGITTIASIVYTGKVFGLLGKYFDIGQKHVFVQFLGGVLVAFGTLVVRLGGYPDHSTYFGAIGIFGVLLMVYHPIKYKLIKLYRVTKFQAVLILLSGLFGYSLTSFKIAILRTIILLAVFILLRSLRSIRILSPSLGHILDVSSWLLVIYAWLWYPASLHLSTCDYYLVTLLYFIIILLWFFSAIVIYNHLKRWM